MNATVQILILSAPFIIEGSIEAWFEMKRKISVNHFWTAFFRVVLMLAISLCFDIAGISTWWQALIFSVILHGSFFNYFYNALTGRPMFYLRAKGLDALLANIPPYGRVFWQIILLVSAAMVYFHLPVILGQERPGWLYPY